MIVCQIPNYTLLELTVIYGVKLTGKVEIMTFGIQQLGKGMNLFRIFLDQSSHTSGALFVLSFISIR